MLRKLLDTSNGDAISFGAGNFDYWCIYVQRKGDDKYLFPLDSWYFSELADMGYNESIYEDFVKIYDRTTKDFDESMPQLISELASKYPDKESVELIYAILYAGMIAEENKENTMLGKRIKRLGMHQTLVDKIAPMLAANFSRGMKWQDIDEHCKTRGF